MYVATTELKQLHHITKLTEAFKSNLQWLQLFVTNWNSIGLINNNLTSYSAMLPSIDIFKEMHLATGGIELALIISG